MANVFGALNRFIARLDSDPNTNSGGPRNALPSNAYGFQILQNTNADIPLSPWFDFIIGINGHNLESSDPNLFVTEVRNCAGTNISLGVFGAKGQQIREIYLAVPAAAKDPSHSLGLALQWTPLSTVEDVWHILDVIPNSPADVGGLLPYSDYVIGSPERAMIKGDKGLVELIESFVDRPLRLFVYNQEYDVTRLVTITPARNWGGDGALGCVLGYGALHRIPAPLNEPTQAPGETLFDATSPQSTSINTFDSAAAAGSTATNAAPSAGSDFLVPANMAFTAPPKSTQSPQPTGSTTGPPPAGRARKARVNPSAAASGLDDYFAEGEQKSREMEGGSRTPKPAASLPPPPSKSGGPPKVASPAAPPPTSEVTAQEEAEAEAA